jgi:hypothetical protein
VTDDAFEVGLSFGGVAERLLVPFEAIKAFADPSVQFTLQFETLAEAPDETPTLRRPRRKSRRKPNGGRRQPVFRRARFQRPPLPPDRPSRRERKPADKGGAEVVRLDRFRKK